MVERKIGGLAVVAGLFAVVLYMQLSSKIEDAADVAANADQNAVDLAGRVESLEGTVSDLENRPTYRW